MGKSKKYSIFKRDKYICYLCGITVIKGGKGPNKATIDHYVPRSRGGTNHSSNLKTCCEKCNLEKADKMPASKKKIKKQQQKQQDVKPLDPRHEVYVIN